MAGVTLNDKRLAAEVRTLTLKEIKRVLEDATEENENFRKQLLLKLAPTVLPRINEHTGEDGEPINFNLINYGQIGNTVPVQAPGISVSATTSSSEVQNSSST